ncbi:oligosaccharide flippase family protein [Polluticoccus soli]|uniref:oligosaccharide flippase family protein n=1 Tax=Polluticoccus soli TaxID=3034150 RepID=UPI0023E2FDFC|nr:oligosaccharide flippase family protein [Flavipsychrobacter sp. JY13-12]
MGIGKKAGKGFLSFLYRNVLEKLVGMVAMIILARKLSPYDFGLVSISEVLLAMVSVFGTTGLAEYLIAYREKDSDELFKSAFWFNIVVSLGILVVFLIAAPLWAYYQGDTRIWKICALVGLLFMFSQLQGIPKTWLSKHMLFEQQVKIQAPFILLIALGKVIAAYCNLGVYSLLIPTLFFQPFITVLLYRTASFRPSWNFYVHRWKDIYRFTRHLMGASILARIADQGDKIILSRVLGLEKLGIYNIAVQLADMLTSQIVMVSNSILSAVLPKYVDDKEQFYAHYINFLKTLSFLLFPVLGILLVAAKPIILTLYGDKWVEAVLPMQILLVYAMLRVVTSSYGCVMNSFHRVKDSFKVTLVYTPFHLVASFIGSLFGLAGLASAVVLIKSVFVNVNIKQIMNLVSKPQKTWYRDLAPSFINTYAIILLMLLFFMVAGEYIRLAPISQIMIIAGVFIIVYYIIFKLLFQRELQNISAFLGVTFPKSQSVFKMLFRI